MAAVSALMLFSRFWDAINDPIVGGLTDKTKTKWGRYRPWLLIAAPITAVLLIMTFLGTSGLVGQIKGYLYGNYILSAGTWIYLCKYPVWNPLWSNDTGYR